jgi:hypothetical protein
VTLEPVPFAHALDEFLRDIVRALHKAVDRGIAGLKTDPAETDHALADSKEMIDTVMAGQVQDWVGEGDRQT